MRNLTTVTAAVCVTMAMSSSWAGTANIGFAGYKGTETLTDFPALIKLPDCAAGFAYADAAANGADIFFTDSGGNVLSHEIDHWNADGASYIWVKVPTLTAATTITMHWGEPLPSDIPAATNTWSGYVGVWHMNAANGSTSTAEPDSSGNGLSAAPIRNTKSGVANRLAELKGMAAGKVGPARQNQSTGGNYNGLKTASYVGKITNVQKMTLGGWFHATAASGWMRLFSAKNSNGNAYGFEAFTLNNTTTTFGASGSTGYSTSSDTAVPDSLKGWVHVQIVYDGTTAKYYANGSLVKSFSVTGIKANNNALYLAIGNDIDPDEAGWCGFYDEVRMYDGVLSADRIKAEYDTANNPVVFTRGHTADLYCSGYDGNEALANFPVCVQIPDCVPNFKYEDTAADGSDIWFSDENGNVLASEKDAWKITIPNRDSPRSSFWVKVPSMTGETRITMHWGGPVPANLPATTEVWTGYAGVWHMGTADGATETPEPDATGHGLYAAPTSTVSSHVSQIKPRSSGNYFVAGNCCQNQTDTGYNGLLVPSPQPYMTDVTKMTIGGWFYVDNPNSYMRLFSAKASNDQNGGWEVWMNNGLTKRYGVTGGTKQNINPSAETYDCKLRWLHFMAVYNGTNVKLYVNGEKYIDGTVGAITARAADAATGDSGGYSFMIGGMPRLNDSSWRGCYDEVRLYNGAMSEARVRALYLAESMPTEFLRSKPRSAGGIVQERPYYGMDFTHSLRSDKYYDNQSGTPTTSTGTGYLLGFGEQFFSYLAIVGFKAISSMGGKALTTENGTTKDNIAGQGFKYGAGDWTYHVRARTGDATNGVVWCLGGVGSNLTALLMTANGANGVSLMTMSDATSEAETRLDVEVPQAALSYHDYAVVFHVSGKTADFYIDGVFKGTLGHPKFSPSDDRWKLLGVWGSNVHLAPSRNARLEDVRFYRRALTAAELASLHAWLSFSAPERNVYTATVSENCQLTDLAWTPEMPSEGFGPDDILDVTCASAECTVVIPTNDMPSVAGMVMRGGILKHAAAHVASAPKWIRLENGASLDENGYAQSKAAYSRIVLGDAAYLRNGGAALNYGNAQFTNGIELMPGATAYLHTTSLMGLIGHNYMKVFVDLNGGTLVKTGTGLCYMANIDFNGGGTLEVREGTVETYKTASAYGTAVLDVKPGATFNSAVGVTIGTLKGAGNINSNGGILTVGNELSGLLTVGGTTNTVFASGATLDLSANASPFVQPSTMTFAGAVNIVLPDGACGKTKLISWDAPPADGVTFAAVDGLPQGMKFDARSDGLYLYRPGMIIIVK